MCMWVLPAYIKVHHGVPAKRLVTRRGSQILWTGVMDGCKPSCGCWELHIDLQQEQPKLLTMEPPF